MINVVDRQVREAEKIAEKVAMNYMGITPSDKIAKAIQDEYEAELKKAGVQEGLITIYLNQQSGSIFIYETEKMLDEKVRYPESKRDIQ